MAGAVLLLAGAAVYPTDWLYAFYMYAVGACAFAGMQLWAAYDGDNLVVRRLRRQQIFGAVLLVCTAVCRRVDCAGWMMPGPHRPKCSAMRFIRSDWDTRKGQRLSQWPQAHSAFRLSWKKKTVRKNDNRLRAVWGLSPNAHAETTRQTGKTFCGNSKQFLKNGKGGLK